MRLNKSTSHAIRILIECAREPGTFAKASELSSTLDLTIQNTLKILHILSRAGLILGERGRYGGVRLARPAADIRIGDVVRAMETTELELSVDASAVEDAGSVVVSGVNRVLENATQAFVAVLDGHTLSDFAERASSAARVAARMAEAPKSPRRKPMRASTRARARSALGRGDWGRSE